MAQENGMETGNELISWNVPEYHKHERTKLWYILAITASLLFMVFSFFTGNFLFAVIIIIAALVIILHDSREPERIPIRLTDAGIMVGNKFYDYDELKNFAIVFKPHLTVKNLYFEFKSAIRPRLSIPLEKENPLEVRKILLKYLAEDLERTDQPLSEALTKIFKL
jgi:hypothetical protein